MIAQEQRAAYEALVGATSEAQASAEYGTESETVGSSGVRPPGAASS
jgi:hypothetical protein